MLCGRVMRGGNGGCGWRARRDSAGIATGSPSTTGGSVPTRLSAGCGGLGCAVGRLKLVVVSAAALVPVIGVVLTGGGVSPGPLIVEVTPLAEPS